MQIKIQIQRIPKSSFSLYPLLRLWNQKFQVGIVV